MRSTRAGVGIHTTQVRGAAMQIFFVLLTAEILYYDVSQCYDMALSSSPIPSKHLEAIAAFPQPCPALQHVLGLMGEIHLEPEYGPSSTPNIISMKHNDVT